MNSISQELVDHIVDDLVGYATPKTLVKYLTALPRAFRRRLRTHLYRTVDIPGFFSNWNERRIHKQFKNFRDLLELSSTTDTHISNCVKDFSVSLGGEGARTIRSLKYTLDNPDFTIILRLLHGHEYGIQSFALLLSVDGGCAYDWNALRKDFRVALVQLTRSPRLDRLELFQFKNVPMDIFRGTTVTHLDTRQLYPSRSKPKSGDLATYYMDPLPQLISLTFDENFPINASVRNEVGSKDTSSTLKTLYAQMTTPEASINLERALQISHNSLERLKLSCSFRTEDSKNQVEANFKIIRRIFSSLPFPQFKVFHLGFSFNNENDTETAFRYPAFPISRPKSPSSEWQLFDKLFTDSPYENVSVSFSLQYDLKYDGPSPDFGFHDLDFEWKVALIDSVRGQLPRLYASQKSRAMCTSNEYKCWLDIDACMSYDEDSD